MHSTNQLSKVAAVVLAAGLSQRMGRPKMVLPWGPKTVIGQVVDVLQSAGMADIYVVTGGEKQRVESALAGKNIQTVNNPDYLNGEMLVSFQVGLRALPDWIDAALVVLGDQPQIQANTVDSVLTTYQEHPDGSIIVPSYHNHRGHPWLLPKQWWGEVLSLASPLTLKDFLNQHDDAIIYVTVEAATVLMDLDTPADYQRDQPTE